MAEPRYKNPASTRGSKPGERRGGRKKGTANYVTKEVKQMILDALDQAHPEGGIGYLVEQSKENPVAFMGLIRAVLPLQITGAGGGAIEVRAVERRIIPVPAPPLKLVSNASS